MGLDTTVEYPTGTVGRCREMGLTKVRVHCVGRHPDRTRCYHYVDVDLSTLPDRLWREVCPKMRCEQCGSIALFSLSFDHREVDTIGPTPFLGK